MPPRSPAALTAADIRTLYDQFDSAVARFDCGKKCAPHNPSGKPFCCDICHAIPAAYTSEWKYFQQNTALWHIWRGDECGNISTHELTRLKQDTPNSMILLACLGPDKCQRSYRALSCRQFPFFPYVTADFRFIGLSYEWVFEDTCWVISNLNKVTQKYRTEFISTFDEIFLRFQDEFENYAYHSEKMRAHFLQKKRRIPILHRNGNSYLLSPGSERLQRVEPKRLPKFGFYNRPSENSLTPRRKDAKV